MTKIAINGFGRIGRLTFRTLFDQKDIEIVAINDLTDAATLAHLLKYDSAQGRWNSDKIEATKDGIKVNGKEIKIFAERDPENLPWKDLGIDIAIESTGFFVDEASAGKHIKAGAKKVVISAPAKGDIKTIVYNVNHKELTSDDKIISGASCTTNCLAPIADVLDRNFGITKGLMTTVHAFTNDQKTADQPHSDLRRARAASTNIIPTTTGAAAAVALVLPNLKGKLDGMAMRVPVITGSLVDLTVEFDKDTTVEEVNALLKKSASETIGVTEDPIVSSDVIGITQGTLVDLLSTSSIEQNGKKLFKIVSWYDNEMSYVNQLCRTVSYFAGL